jgi:mono/diheme cytochrome c family protein
MRNRFYIWLLFISAAVLIAYLGLATYREMTPEWKKHQLAYREFLVKKAQDAETRDKARALTPEVQQIYLGALEMVDRCTSCHIGVEVPLMAHAEQPLAQHSGDHLKNHPADRFGCTVCHYGQGRATNEKEAHGLGHDSHWDHPIIPLEYIQSSCASCHDLGMLRERGGEKLIKGEKLFREKGCKGCHKLDGVGGVLGKALDAVGSQPVAYFPMTSPVALPSVKGEKTVYSWMKQHFDDPRNLVLGSEMKSDFTDQESDLLTTYVLSLRSGEMPKKYRRIRETPQQEGVREDGESLFKMYCVACHTTGKDSVNDEVFKRTIPAIMNPAFLKAAGNAYLKKVIEEGRAGTQMTAWKTAAAGLTDREINALVDYLAKDRPRERPEPFRYAGYKGDAARGRELYEVRCVSCHGARGQGGVGLNLRNPVVQKEAEPDFLAITIRDGRAGTHMAAFGRKGVGLSEQDIADIVSYVRTLSQKK